MNAAGYTANTAECVSSRALAKTRVRLPLLGRPSRCRLPARRDVGLQPHADLKATGRRRHVLVARVAQPQREAAVDHRPAQVEE